MRRRQVITLALALACASFGGCGEDEPANEQVIPETEPIAIPEEADPPADPTAGTEVPGFYGFRVPAGGQGGPPPHGGTSMVVYQYSMTREALDAATRALITEQGWTIASDETSPRGSIRLNLTKDANTLDLRIAGEGPSASIILTRSDG